MLLNFSKQEMSVISLSDLCNQTQQDKETVGYLFGWQFIHCARELLKLFFSQFQSCMRMFHLKRRQGVQLSLGHFLLCFCVKLRKLFL